jgi:DNA-binding transcriptional regulator PaaX
VKDHIMEFQKQIKINELRDRFEKCWEVDEWNL